MIFVTAATEPTVFLLLTEADVATMRGGRTVFIDQRQTGGVMFNHIVLSLHKNMEEAKSLLRRAGKKIPDDLPEPQPVDHTEGRCRGCQGVMKAYSLLDGMCCACWREKAQHYELLANGGKPCAD